MLTAAGLLNLYRDTVLQASTDGEADQICRTASRYGIVHRKPVHIARDLAAPLALGRRKRRKRRDELLMITVARVVPIKNSSISVSVSFRISLPT